MRITKGKNGDCPKDVTVAPWPSWVLQANFLFFTPTT
jgi:hypothetical protein